MKATIDEYSDRLAILINHRILMVRELHELDDHIDRVKFARDGWRKLNNKAYKKRVLK